MGYTIIDARSFIKTTRGIIPLALGGSNNCSEFIYDRNFKPREVRERHWFLLGGINLLELPEDEFVAKVNTTFPDNGDECWRMNSKWVTCSQARKWFARAAKDAATLEDILAANPGVNDLNVGLMPYTSGDHLLWRYVRTTDELEVWLDEARELVKEHKDHYIFMSFSGTQRGERLRPARARDVKGPLVVQKRNAGYVRAFDNVNGGGSQMPQNQKASNVAKQATKDAQSADKKKGKKNDSGSGSGGNDANKGNIPAAVAGKSGDGQDKNGKQEQADSMLANVLQTIISSVAGNMAEAQMEQDLKSQIIADVDIMDRSSTHKGHSIDVKREVEVTPSNIKLYGEMMEDVSQYSKRLAKLMQQELKDLQDGDVRRNRMYGRDIVASEMWRPDCRFFSDTKLPQDLPDMAVSVLVDQSGSMYGQRMGAAMKATMLLHDFAERVHVPVAVYGHNVTMHGRVNLFVYTDFLKAGKRDKYRLAKLSTGGCNRDGAALEVVANLLNARPERTKLLIIISDGKPNDDSYGGDSAAKDIKDIVARNRRRGVEIVAAAIGDDKEYLKKIYGDQFLDITDLSTFPKAMVKIVKKRLKV